MIKTLAFVSVFIGALFFTLAYQFINLNSAMWLIVGFIFMLLNTALIGSVWKLIFSKKSIALVLLIIIFKYVILAVLIWYLAQKINLNAVGFSLGILAFLVSIILSYALGFYIKRSK
jgi:hypothetical protein